MPFFPAGKLEVLDGRRGLTLKMGELTVLLFFSGVLGLPRIFLFSVGSLGNVRALDEHSGHLPVLGQISCKSFQIVKNL